MADVLAQIMAHKRAETTARMGKTPLAEIKKRAEAAPPVRPFAAALRNAAVNGRYPVIAEIKRKSPSKGVLCENFNVAEIAQNYQRGGGACLSVLTDEAYFGGSAENLKTARAACTLPVLRKDFIVLGDGRDNWKIAEWQLYESRAMGADAVLFIVGAFETYGAAKESLADEYKTALGCCLEKYVNLASDLGMATLIEVHYDEELECVLRSVFMVSRKVTGGKGQVLIGVNNRNLETFKTDINTTITLSEKINDYIKKSKEQYPGTPYAHFHPIFISESGIHSPEDIEKLKNAGAEAFLIGESLVNNPEEGLRRLFDG